MYVRIYYTGKFIIWTSTFLMKATTYGDLWRQRHRQYLKEYNQNMKNMRWLFANKTWQIILTRKLGSTIIKTRQENLAILFGGFSMNKEEILEKSRAENKNKDIYEQEILKQASSSAVIVMMVLATVFFAVQIFVGGGANWGIWALVFSANMTTLWVKYIKLRRKHELVMAIVYTILIAAFSGSHIYHLIVSSTIL